MPSPEDPKKTPGTTAKSVSEDALRAALEAVNTPLAIRDADGVIVWSNPAIDQLAASRAKSVAGLIEEAETMAAEADQDDRDRSRLLATRLTDGSAAEPLWLCQLLDAGASTRLAPSLDETTGVLSRTAILDAVEAWHVRRSERPFALLFADLDRFKSVNDTHGHAAGDVCLAAVGERLRTALRAEDAVGRYGGDEFLILIAASHADHVRQAVERLQSRVAQPIPHADGSASVSLSVGIAYSAEEHGSPAEMIAAADRAMYARKLPAGDR